MKTLALKPNNIFLLAVLTVATTFAVLVLWETWLEIAIKGLFSEPSSEVHAVHWELILTGTVSSAVGWLVSGPLLYSIVSKYEQASEEINQFKSTLDQTLDCVFMFRPGDFHFFYGNQGALEQVGYTLEELTRITPIDIKPEVDEAGFRQLVAPLLDGSRRSLNFETVHEHKNGGRVPVEIFLQYIAPVNEQPRFVAIVRDIAERRKADEEINQFKSTLDQTLDCVFMFRPGDFRFFYCNQGALEQVGYTFEELKQMTAIDIKPEVDEAGFRQLVAPLLDGSRRSLNFETVHEHKNGGRVPVEIFLQYIAPVNEQPRFVAIVRDITERRKARAALQEAHDTLERRVEDRTAALAAANSSLEQEVAERKSAERKLATYSTRLETSNRELQDFASIASHDLQEPLRKIEAFSERLAVKCTDQLSDDGKSYLERVLSSAGRMRTLINDLLTYSRVTSKGEPFLPTDLSEVARGVLSDLETSAEEAGAQIELGDLPTVDADAGQMRQLLQNLIGNAIKYRKRDVPPAIRVSGETIPGSAEGGGEIGEVYCQVKIEDNGIGFEEKYAQRIFGVFERLHGRGEYEGTGIGLANCWKIVDRHFGHIRASSAPGEGSTFTFTLPVRQAKQEEAA